MIAVDIAWRLSANIRTVKVCSGSGPSSYQYRVLYGIGEVNSRRAKGPFLARHNRFLSINFYPDPVAPIDNN